VRGGDHDAGVYSIRAREVGHGRRRDDAGARQRAALLRTPNASSRSIQPPDSRVSRPTGNGGRAPAAACRSARTSAAPRRRTVGSSGVRRPCRARRRSEQRPMERTLPSSEVRPRLTGARAVDSTRCGPDAGGSTRRSPTRPGARRAPAAAAPARALQHRPTRRRSRGDAPRLARPAHVDGHLRRDDLRAAYRSAAARTGTSTTPTRRARRDVTVTCAACRARAAGSTDRPCRRSRSSVTSSVWHAHRHRLGDRLVSRATALAGPTTSTVAGSARGADHVAVARFAVHLRHDRHHLRCGRLEGDREVRGRTCTTSTPNGARTSAIRWKSRRPGRAVRRSSTATSHRVRFGSAPRTTPAPDIDTLDGGSPTSSSPCGRF
jgi:hypothetical protein